MSSVPGSSATGQIAQASNKGTGSKVPKWFKK